MKLFVCLRVSVLTECYCQCRCHVWRWGRGLQYWQLSCSGCLVELCVLGSESSVVRSCPPQSLSQSSRPRLPAENTHARGVDADETPGCPFLGDGQGAYKYVCVGAVGVPVATVDAETA